MKLLAVLISFTVASSALAMPVTGQTEWRDRVIGTSTTWINPYGSVMTLDVSANGMVRGYMVNNAPGTGCRGIPYELRGRVKGDFIAFQVRWRNGVADCQSETEWRGTVRTTATGQLEFVSHCHHRHGLRGEHVSIGVDRFVKRPPDVLRSLLEH